MSFVFQSVRLIDGVAESSQQGLDVAVKGERIESVAPTGSIDWPQRGYEVIGGEGRTLLPGLIDCHVHYTLDPLEPDFVHTIDSHAFRVGLTSSRQASGALMAGVTTARSAGAHDNLDFMLRDAIDDGRILGPRMLAAGMVLGMTGGHGYKLGHELEGSVEYVRAVRQQVRDGADVIKIMASEAAMLTTTGLAPGRFVAGRPEVTLEEAEAAVAEARRLGVRVLAHAQDSEAVRIAARAGVDSVEHAFLADGDALRTLRDHGATLVPTLVVTDVNYDRDGLTTVQRDRQRLISQKHRESCETAISLGIPIASGTDAGEYGVTGAMLWREIALLRDHGLSAMGAIKAATSNAASLLGVDASVGTVTPGKLADLVLVEGDPLQDLALLAEPLVVMKGGTIFRRAQ